MMKTMGGMMLVLGLASCGERAPPTAAPVVAPAPAGAASSAAMAKLPTNAWLGRWVGPEGLFLDIAAKGGAYSGRYTVTNRYTLDAEEQFEAVADRDTLVFVRDGKPQRLRAGSGDETGMKWLGGKHDCLVVAAGEGYCRP